MTCAKRQVRCTLVALDGRAATGMNDCDNPQPACPRADGEGYDKCTTVCRQPAHAEVAALRAANEAGLDLRGGVAIVAGHYRICDACENVLRAAGITNFIMGYEWLEDGIPEAALPRSMYQARYGGDLGPASAVIDTEMAHELGDLVFLPFDPSAEIVQFCEDARAQVDRDLVKSWDAAWEELIASFAARQAELDLPLPVHDLGCEEDTELHATPLPPPTPESLAFVRELYDHCGEALDDELRTAIDDARQRAEEFAKAKKLLDEQGHPITMWGGWWRKHREAE